MSYFVFPVYILCLFISFGASYVAKKPVIGILSTPSDFHHLHNDPQEISYIKASYAEFVEAADGIPVAIPWDLPERELVSLLDSVNGLLFTGGDASLWEFDDNANEILFNEFTKRTSFILRYAIHLNDKGVHYPVYGICQGHEVITMGIAGRPHIIDNYKHPVQYDTVEITETGKSSRMFGNMPDHISAFIRDTKSMFYNHRYGFNMSLLMEQSILHEFFVITAKGVDNHGKEFIAALEAKEYPIYTVQYHPERVLSEWKNKTHFSHPEEAAEAILVQARFFVDEAKKNQQRFADEENLNRFLLKNHNGIYFNITWPNVYFYEKKSPIQFTVFDLSDDEDTDQFECDDADGPCGEKRVIDYEL